MDHHHCFCLAVSYMLEGRQNWCWCWNYLSINQTGNWSTTKLIIVEPFKRFIKQKWQTGSSFSYVRVYCFALFYVIINGIFWDFGRTKRDIWRHWSSLLEKPYINTVHLKLWKMHITISRKARIFHLIIYSKKVKMSKFGEAGARERLLFLLKNDQNRLFSVHPLIEMNWLIVSAPTDRSSYLLDC